MKSVMVISLALFFVFGGVNANDHTEVYKLDIGGESTTYIPHAPIWIMDDFDFQSQASSEGWPGSGTPGDPYVIEGYDINGSIAGHCIWIETTTAHFEINNC